MNATTPRQRQARRIVRLARKLGLVCLSGDVCGGKNDIKIGKLLKGLDESGLGEVERRLRDAMDLMESMRWPN